MIIEIDMAVAILCGHVVGDYMLQPRSMAMEKSKNSAVCFAHCVVYTSCMSICFLASDGRAVFQPGLPIWLALVFVTHFIIDRWSLAERWQRHFLDNGWTVFLGKRPTE